MTSNSFAPTRQVLEYLKVSRMTLWRIEQNPDLNFPKPARINGRKLWPMAEIENWLEEARG